jgi:hypothetical protein
VSSAGEVAQVDLSNIVTRIDDLQALSKDFTDDEIDV